MKQRWELRKLNEIAIVGAGNSAPQKKELFTNGTYPFIRTSDVGKIRKGFIRSSVDYLNIDGIKGLKLHRKGTILFPKSGASTFLNHRVMMEIDSYVSSHLATIKGNNLLINDKFLFYFLMTIDARNLMQDIAYPSLKTSDIGLISIPLPPLLEQQHLVNILDQLFIEIGKIKTRAKQNLKNAKELFESYLQSIFSNNQQRWQVKMLGEVAITNGRIGWKGLTAKEYTNEGPLFISVHSLNYGDYVDFRDAFHISQDRYRESPEIMLKKNDILICKDGAGIGKLGIIKDLHKESTINSSLLLIRCKKEILSKYLYYNLLSPIFQSIVQSRLSGATTPHLYQRDIVTFPVLLPPINEQKSIIRKLETLSTEIKRLEAIYKKKIEDLEELKRSILDKAFAGELTTKNVIQLQKVKGITATDLQAGITALALQKHLQNNQEDTFHHVKAEKIVHLAEYILNVDLERNPIKDAAGPNDFPRAKFVESRAKKAGFYSVFKNGEYYDYRQGNKINSVIFKAQNCLGEKSITLTEILDILVSMKTYQTEIVATVYAAWNNLILSGNQFTDDDIVTEARENWHNEKLLIPKEKFIKAIEWMRKIDILIPKGNGKFVRAK